MTARHAHGAAVLLVGEAEPLVHVEYDTPDDPRDSGYAIVFADQADTDPDLIPDDALEQACIGCVVSRWPHAQTGMAIAREHGAAELDPEGQWQPA